MGHLRDEQMFRENDAKTSGFNDGHREASNVAFLSVGDALGVPSETVKDLTARNLGKRMLALQSVQSVIASSLEAVSSKLDMYTDLNPGIVAQAIMADKVPEQDDRGYTSTDDYKFVLNDAGEVEVHTGRYLDHYIDRLPINGDWVQRRLAVLGIDQDEIFCGHVAEHLTETIAGERLNG